MEERASLTGMRLNLGDVFATGKGKRMMPKKIKQLEEWPEPTTIESVVSFLCFVSYLREFLPPEWLDHEKVLGIFRKKDASFSWWAEDEKYSKAFYTLRGMLRDNCVLHHPRFQDAAEPEVSGCPFEMFIDASDFAWAAVLTQRLEPHGAPKIISIKAKSFDPTQQRWSAMERELYALWQGVVQHEPLIKGFKTYCYIDHKNNIFSEAQLDNRRRSKKMSNWALELQQFDVVRVWIRGEANVLSDAPSRAPWDSELVKHLSVPCDRPLRDLISMMFTAPKEFEELVETRNDEVLGKDQQWQPLNQGAPSDLSHQAVVGSDDELAYQTPRFGNSPMKVNREIIALLGEGECVPDVDEGFTTTVERMRGQEWPKWPGYVCTEVHVEKCFTGLGLGVRPTPINALDLPIVFRGQKNRGASVYVLEWKSLVPLSDGKKRRVVTFNRDSLGDEEARRQAWEFWKRCYRQAAASGSRLAKGPTGPFGPLGEAVEGARYHGTGDNHEFRTVPGFGRDNPVNMVSARRWNAHSETFERPEEFCGHCEVVGEADASRGILYECLGHAVRREAPTVGVQAPPGVDQIVKSTEGVDDPMDIWPEAIRRRRRIGSARRGCTSGSCGGGRTSGPRRGGRDPSPGTGNWETEG